MASCARIEQTIQSYIDGEQSASERVIFEKHIADCADCRHVLDAQRRCTADLFEVLSHERIPGTLAPYVIEHLPEMVDSAQLHIDHTQGQRDLAEVNQRAKHPRPWREYSLRAVPIAAMFVLVFLGYTLMENWPDAPIPGQAVGSITYADGMAFQFNSDSDDQFSAELKTIAVPGDRFETESDGQLMLTLIGPTHVKLASDTRVRIHSNRRISVEKGRVFLDVSKGDRMFRVITPESNVTVFGTTFNVDVLNGQTTVAVRDGEVQVESGEIFTQITPGEQVSVRPGIGQLVPETVAIDQIATWADQIVPDIDALQFFTARLAPMQPNLTVQGKNVWFIQPDGKPISYIELEWKPVRKGIEPREYQVYVFRLLDDTLLFKGQITAQDMKEGQSIQLYNRTNPDARSEIAYVRVVPNYETGQGEARFTNCRAGLVQ